MKIQQLINEQDIQQSNQQSPTIDSIPRLRRWLKSCEIDESVVEVHGDSTITINSGVDYISLGTGPSSFIPAVIRKIDGHVSFYIENNLFEDAPKLNIHKWIKEITDVVTVNMYDPSPILSFFKIKIGERLYINYNAPTNPDDLDNTDFAIDEELALITQRAFRDHADPIQLQEQLIDAGYGKFARM